jgi:hypothetical protein
MSSLTTRGSSKNLLYTRTDAEYFLARSKGPHTLRWLARAYRFLGSSGEEELMDKIPVVGGTLTMDSSDITRRKLTLQVGGGKTFEPLTSNDPLTPFGQFIRLWVSIDRADGTYFPWLMMGEFAIQSYVFERPSQIATVEAMDWSVRVGEFLHEWKVPYGGLKVADAINKMVKQALPDKGYAMKACYRSRTETAKWISDSGSSRWEEAVALGERYAFDVFFDWAGDLIIRENIGDGTDDQIPETGPDIGTRGSPIMTVRDGLAGSLIGMTSTITRDGACNGVIINIHETADQKAKDAKARAARGDSRVDVTVKALAGSNTPVTYGDRFGRIPIVYDRSVPKITDAVVSQYQKNADAILHRRRGVVRYIDLSMVGGYHLEPDDKVRLQFDGRTEDHFIQSIEWNLAGGETKVRTRQLNVDDPQGVA